ncbi:MAG TPA: sporulation protein [Thermotoga sp.]|nr:sporulation protein [Thermotoga sp.]
MRWKLLLILLIHTNLFAIKLIVCYIDPVSLNPVLKTVEVENDNFVLKIFDILASPPKDLMSFVPEGVLRAYFIVDDVMILDLNGDKLKSMDFLSERYFVHTILYTIFNNLKTVNTVYFTIDGSRKRILANYVDIRYGFPRRIWEKWPVKKMK